MKKEGGFTTQPEGMQATINPAHDSTHIGADTSTTAPAAPAVANMAVLGAMLVLLLANLLLTLDLRANIPSALPPSTEAPAPASFAALLQAAGVVRVKRDPGTYSQSHPLADAKGGFNGFPRTYPRGYCDAKADTGNISSFFQMGARDINGTFMNFSSLAGKVVLVVNVASYCHKTVVNYHQLNKLYSTYHDRGLVILGFPCNQFGHQEWPTNEEIPLSLRHVRPGGNYVPRFPLFSKIKVNGRDTHPVYVMLRRSCTNPRSDISDTKDDIIWSPVEQSDISWNFEKFLISPKTGKPVFRYPHHWDPTCLAQDIESLLADGKPPNAALAAECATCLLEKPAGGGRVAQLAKQANDSVCGSK